MILLDINNAVLIDYNRLYVFIFEIGNVMLLHMSDITLNELNFSGCNYL